ncbi:MULTISPECIES: hypothetical protein [Neisseria]|uniref:hypothetical protein n=1 Tax=Neisseria TaxID=482 RepID=UPI001072838A|nr:MULTISPECIES: hypothetical protein [Neisseria]MBF0802836.1 hypothetical protein [Neisseria sp. 19428wB4_WF04]TFU44622.1 hypothetical protein E4T99_00370 [Neisseria sp. WF04]
MVHGVFLIDCGSYVSDGLKGLAGRLKEKNGSSETRIISPTPVKPQPAAAGIFRRLQGLAGRLKGRKRLA